MFHLTVSSSSGAVLTESRVEAADVAAAHREAVLAALQVAPAQFPDKYAGVVTVEVSDELHIALLTVRLSLRVDYDLPARGSARDALTMAARKPAAEIGGSLSMPRAIPVKE